ncbi:MAG: peptide chain release factor 2, partial [Nitrospirota bacterium]|nr:peptide chain release factor 2 [Nitrospirota bacterium]
MNSYGGIFDLASSIAEVDKLTEASQAQDFWDDPAKAQENLGLKTRLEKSLKRWDDIDQDLEEAELLITL